jgi:formamidopyrimidine-DNA glycosylase
MPELPEVETVANGVHARIHGQTIRSVWTSNKPQTFKSPPDEIVEALTGSRIDRVHRVGKTIVIDLSRKRKPTQFLVHLGMTGRLLVITPDAPVAPHTHARLTMISGRELRFVDPRRFGRLEFRDLGLNAASTAPSLKAPRFAAPRFKAPGSEPLVIQSADFAALFRGRRLAIKAALLNQTLLAGVGNIYADESLFRAGLRPRRQAGRLTHAQLERLRLALREVLEHAIRLGGSSVSDYVDAEGVRGFFQLEHCVYQRTGQPCRVCKTPIKRITVAGRSTHYCPHCQH